MTDDSLEFYVTASVDCPLTEEDQDTPIFYVINWIVNGSLGSYTRPTPIYIKVLENVDELTSIEEWCEEGVDCSNPSVGQTCIMDDCLVNAASTERCTPLFVEQPSKDSGGYSTNQKLMMLGIVLFLLYNILQFLGFFQWIKKRYCEKPEEVTDDSEEKKIFNTRYNMEQAEIAIEELLRQIRQYEVCLTRSL